MLSLINLTKKYKKKSAINDISIELEDNRTVGVIGPNGAGKSTLFNLISGILKANSGQILFDKNPIKLSGISPRLIGYALQLFGLHPDKTVNQELNYLIELSGLEASSYKKHLEKFLKKSHLEEFKDKKIKTLSQGNIQKLNLFQAQLNNPKILLYDEPFNALDIEQKNYVKQEIINQKKNSSLILISSHNLTDIGPLCDSFLFIQEGQIVEYIDNQTIQNTFMSFETVKDEVIKIQEFLSANESLDFILYNRYDATPVFILHSKDKTALDKKNYSKSFQNFKGKLEHHPSFEDLYFYFIR